jgi:hypothetical protein
MRLFAMDAADMARTQPLAGNQVQERLDIDIDHANSYGNVYENSPWHTVHMFFQRSKKYCLQLFFRIEFFFKDILPYYLLLQFF